MRKDVNTCPNCGSKIEYSPKIKALKCFSCGTIQQIKVTRAKERIYNFDNPSNKINGYGKKTKCIKCERCGAVEVLNKNDLSETCPFCGNTTIIDVENNEFFSPTAIMPFTISKEEAKFAFIEKIKTNKWMPNKLKKVLNIKEPKGVYSPVYSFDAYSYCNYSGTVGKDEEVTYISNGEQKKVIERKYCYVSGRTDLHVDDILIDAGQVINGVILKKLEPFDSNNSVEFNEKFLYGFSANQSKKSLNFAYKQMIERVKQIFENKIVEIHNADCAGDLKIDLFMNNVTYKYILLPVYIDGFTYGKKTYTLYCNGTTSKVVGKLPISILKVLGTILGVLGVIGIVILSIILSII